jgi:hypothetical protein
MKLGTHLICWQTQECVRHLHSPTSLHIVMLNDRTTLLKSRYEVYWNYFSVWIPLPFLIRILVFFILIKHRLHFYFYVPTIVRLFMMPPSLCFLVSHQVCFYQLQVFLICFYWFLPTVLVLESNVLEFKMNYVIDVPSGTALSGAQICVLKLYNTDESQHRILQFTEYRKHVLSLHRSGHSDVSLPSHKGNSRNVASFNILHTAYHVQRNIHITC